MSSIDKLIDKLKDAGFDVELVGATESHEGVTVLLNVWVPDTNRCDSVILFEPHFIRPLGVASGPHLPS